MGKYSSSSKYGVKSQSEGGYTITPSTLLTGLAAYWKMDETSGTRVDLVNGYNASAVGSPPGVTGKVGNAVDCSVGNTLSVTSNADLQTGNRDFTFSFWINVDSLQPNVDIMGKEGTTPFNEFVVVQANSQISFVVLTDVAVAGNIQTPGSVLTVGQYAFVVVWQDIGANNVNIQVNDGTVNSATRTDVPGTNSVTLKFGRSSQGPTIDGKLDEIGRWNRVLTAGERTRLYNGGVALTYPFN